MVAAAFFVYVQPKDDAKDVLGDARPVVRLSLSVSDRAQADVTRFIRSGNTSSRQRAVRELNRAINLRERAIARLRAMSDIGFPGDNNYQDAARLWASELRGSIKALRGLRSVLPKRRSEETLTSRGEAALVLSQMAFLDRWERLLRRTDRQIIADLI